MKKLFFSTLLVLIVVGIGNAQTLIAHYPFRNTVEDVTGNHEHAGYPNCVFVENALYTKGVFGGDDKTKNSISTAPLYKLDFKNFSISLKMKAAEIRRMPVFVLGKSCRLLGVNVTAEGNFELQGNNRDRFQTTAKKCNKDQWYDVLVTYSETEGNAVLYVDKEKIATMPLIFEEVCLNAWKYSNYDIGSAQNYNYDAFHGYWKDLKVYNGTRQPATDSGTEINNVSTSGTSVVDIKIKWPNGNEVQTTEVNHYPLNLEIESNQYLSGIRIYRNTELIKTYHKDNLGSVKQFQVKGNVTLHKGENKIEVHVFSAGNDKKVSRIIKYHVAHTYTNNDINSNLTGKVIGNTKFEGYGIEPAVMVALPDNGSMVGWEDSTGELHLTKLDATGKKLKDILVGKSYKLYALCSDGTGGVAALLVDPKKGTGGKMEWIYLVKFNKDGAKVFTKKLYGDNDFSQEGNVGFSSWSTPRLLFTGERYYSISGIYRKWNDGVVHQGDILIILDKEGNPVEQRPYYIDNKYVMTNGWTWGTSHSFQQRMVYDGNYVHVIAKGDAYPRGISYKRILDNLELPEPATASKNIFEMSGKTGENYVPLTLGDIESAGNGASVVSFASSEGRESYDLAFAYISKEGNPVVKWLTHTTHTDENNVYMAPYGDHNFIAWNCLDATGGEKTDEDVKYKAAVVDVDGEFVVKPFDLNAKVQARWVVHEQKWYDAPASFGSTDRGVNDLVTYPNGDIGWVYLDRNTGDIWLYRIKK